MSNLDLVTPGQGTPEENAFLAAVPPINLFRAYAHAPKTAMAVAQLGGALLYESGLDARVREMAILRAAHCAGCDYEVVHHERIGRDVGLGEAELAAVRPGGDTGVLDGPARLACAWAETAAAGRSEPGLGGDLIAEFGETGAVELVTTIGYYLMVAGFLTAFAVPVEASGFDRGVDINTRPETLS